jgi:hypothetical protein
MEDREKSECAPATTAAVSLPPAWTSMVGMDVTPYWVGGGRVLADAQLGGG